MTPLKPGTPGAPSLSARERAHHYCAVHGLCYRTVDLAGEGRVTLRDMGGIHTAPCNALTAEFEAVANELLVHDGSELCLCLNCEAKRSARHWCKCGDALGEDALCGVCSMTERKEVEATARREALEEAAKECDEAVRVLVATPSEDCYEGLDEKINTASGLAMTIRALAEEGK